MAFDGAHHAFDWPLLAKPVRLANAQTTRGCRVSEDPSGGLVVGESGGVFSYDDPCIERAATVAWQEAAHRRAREAVRSFLVSVLRP